MDFNSDPLVLEDGVVPAAYLDAGRGLLSGLVNTAAASANIEAPWSGAIWLLSPCVALDGRVPVDLLRQAPQDAVDRVIDAAEAAAAEWCRSCNGDPEEG